MMLKKLVHPADQVALLAHMSTGTSEPLMPYMIGAAVAMND